MKDQLLSISEKEHEETFWWAVLETGQIIQNDASQGVFSQLPNRDLETSLKLLPI